MDHRAAAMAALLGAPPGLGMGLALLSVTRGEALLESLVLGVIAAAALSAGIYWLTSDPSPRHDNQPSHES